MTRTLVFIIGFFCSVSFAREFVAYEEMADGSVVPSTNYRQVIPTLGKGDIIVFRAKRGDIRYRIGEMGRLGGERFSEIFDIGNGKVLRLNKDPSVNAIPSFVESAKLLTNEGVPVVEVFHEGKLGDTSVSLVVSYEKKLMTLREIGLGLGANLGPTGPRSNPLMEQHVNQFKGKIGVIGEGKIKAAFLTFVAKAAPFIAIDDLHPDNLVLIEKEGGELEFKVWDTGTGKRSETQLIGSNDSANRKSFLDEYRMKAMIEGPFRSWVSEIQSVLTTGREQYLRTGSSFNACEAAYPAP